MMQVRQTPLHLWFVGVISLLWHAGGGFDYVSIQSGDADYLQMTAQSLGVGAEAVRTYFDGWPALIHATWAIGVWGGVLGSLLLMLRSRFAFHAFLASVAGTTVTFLYRMIDPLEGVQTSLGAVLMTVLIFAASVLLIRYSKLMTASGVLR
ncbi:MAG: hypothetical protein WA954_07450 [Parerythrobacter sp.]